MLAPNAYAVAAKKLADLAIGLKKKYDHEIQYLDLGGGFPSTNTLKGSYLQGKDSNPTFDQMAEAITSALVNADFNGNELPVLILETGRALIDDAGFLLGTVISNKRSAAGKRITIIDVGVNILFTSFWYDHKISPAQEFSSYTEDTMLYGPLCMNIDVVRENAVLPLLNKGDRFVIHQVGAYNMTQWMQFITLRPNVVMVGEDGKTHVVRKKETLDNINSMEQVPEHLRKFNL
jgi:diaminopimelate decarboxylase